MELFQIAVSCGADFNALSKCDGVMKTILHEAIDDGKLNWITMLVEGGIDLNICSSQGETSGKSIARHVMSLRNELCNIRS